MVPDDSDRIPRVPPYSGGLLGAYPLPVRDFHPLRSGFPAGSGSYMHLRWKLLQPRHVLEHNGLGSVPFDRHYSGYRLFLSLPQGTKMFQFPWFAPTIVGDGSSTRRVAPFGHARINSCLQIPAPFRSLPRPSSPPEA